MGHPDPQLKAIEGQIVSEWGTVLPDSVTYHRTRDGKTQTLTKPVSKKLDQALHYYTIDGIDQAESARMAGITPSALAQALVRPHIQERVKAIRQNHLTRAGVKSIKRIIDLGDQNENKTVALDASRYIVTLAGMGPSDNRGISANSGGARLVTMVLNKKNGTGVRVTKDGDDTTVEVVTDAMHLPDDE